MFERTLQDLIRGLRAHKGASEAQEDAFIAEAMGEIREELKGKDMALKGEGVIKMCYLMMLCPIPPPAGFAFHVVEVMSSPSYHLKRKYLYNKMGSALTLKPLEIGYLAAPMAFSGDTEEIVLTVNGIKKDLLSPYVSLPPLPLTALPHLLSLSPSLSTSLHPDLLHLLTHSSPRIRKRAVLCLLPCWEAFPEGLREGFSRLRERLQDDDQGVVGATVGVVMELARRQGGKNYLPLAPELFKILTESNNNWMLIKVVKLFAILTPLESRLVRKLLPPITSLISNTAAISLLYECVRTCIVGGMLDPDRMEADALARVCVEKLGGYLRDEGGDQNLRYIALLAMVKIIPTHPQMVAEFQTEILESLNDPDVSIRMRALELATNMVNPDNLQTIADTLLSHLAPQEANQKFPSATASLMAISSGGVDGKEARSKDPSSSSAYRYLLTTRLLNILSYNTYANITDFEWTLSMLIDISYISHVNVSSQIKQMVLDIIGRVRDVRSHGVGLLEKIIGDDEFRDRVDDEEESAGGLLEAAIFVCGEYPSELSSPLSTISNLLIPFASSTVNAMAVQSVAKVFGFYCTTVSASWSPEKFDEANNLVASISSGLKDHERSSRGEIEVIERIAEIQGLLGFVKADLDSQAASSRPTKKGNIPELEGGFESDEQEKDEGEPSYPKSLYIFPPLSTCYPLNAVATHAQSSVPLPPGLNLDQDIVPGGGWPVLEELNSEEDEKSAFDLGTGGGESMEELRRVLRESQNKKDKGKEGKEDKAERARRQAARRAKHKDDPYYLYDRENDDVNSIPIVKLDDSDLLSEDAEPSEPKLKMKEKKPQPIFDRTGELPEGASHLAHSTTKLRDTISSTNSGLANIDLSQAPSRVNHFEEYKLDEEEIPSRSNAVIGNGVAHDTGDNNETQIGQADIPVKSVPEVQVVKVRKKKENGDKRKKDKKKIRD
nr:AP-3 complex subunit delta-1 [Cryptococcus depauperatus CBS 7841]